METDYSKQYLDTCEYINDAGSHLEDMITALEVWLERIDNPPPTEKGKQLMADMESLLKETKKLRFLFMPSIDEITR